MAEIMQTRNQLLVALPSAELDRLRPHLSRVRLIAGQTLLESGQHPEHLFFIEDGVAGMMSNREHGRYGVQVAMIGREGVVGGLSLLDSSSAAAASTVTQIAGLSLRILATELHKCMDNSPVLRATCLSFLPSLTRQIMANAAWNAVGSLTERCLRWLLMAHERMDGHALPVTQEALAEWLGVRRSGVTAATSALQASGLIHTSRGRITVLAPALLQQAGRGFPGSGLQVDSELPTHGVLPESGRKFAKLSTEELILP